MTATRGLVVPWAVAAVLLAAAPFVASDLASAVAILFTLLALAVFIHRRVDRQHAAHQAARDELEAAETQRRQLLADITHELATPLTSIRGYTETLQDPEVPISDAERDEFLTNILEEARRMEMLIQDLFEMARLESGTVSMRDELLDWAALYRHTVERYQPKFDRVGLRLIDAGGPDAAWVEADGRRMEQVLENLLINAVRYVPEGGTVWVSMAPRATGEGVDYRLEVVDDGPGFPADELDRVFDRFYRGNLTESFPGSGLGLAIVKEIVERQGGTVEAANRTPSGAVLAIVLPAVGPAAPAGPAADP